MDSITVKLINRVAIINELHQKDSLIKEFEEIIKYRQSQIKKYDKILINENIRINNLESIIINKSIQIKYDKKKARRRIIYSFGLGFGIGTGVMLFK